MRNADLVKVLFIIKKSMKKCCQNIKTSLLFLISLYHIVSFIIILNVVYITKISVLPVYRFHKQSR